MTTATFWYYCETAPVTHLRCISHMYLMYAVRTMPTLFLLHYSPTRGAMAQPIPNKIPYHQSRLNPHNEEKNYSASSLLSFS